MQQNLQAVRNCRYQEVEIVGCSNPTRSQLTINLATSANEVSIRVYDLQGRMIFLPTSDIPLATSFIQLNTTTLRDGFYTIQITNYSTGKIEVGKFVKEN